MKTFTRYTLLAWLTLSWVFPMTAMAAISSQRASEIARQHMPGRVLAVNQAQYQGREVYQIKLLNTQGEVHIILIDANSGKRVSK